MLELISSQTLPLIHSSSFSFNFYRRTDFLTKKAFFHKNDVPKKCTHFITSHWVWIISLLLPSTNRFCLIIHLLGICWSRSSITCTCFVLGLACSLWSWHLQWVLMHIQAVIAKTFLFIRKQWNCWMYRLRHHWLCAEKEM